MNAKQILGEELVNSIIKAVICAKESSQEERMILVDCLRDEARKQHKDSFSSVLSRLADYIESTEV